MRGVPQEIASIVESRHQQAGVEFYLGVAISGIEQAGAEQVITLADGRVIACDMIIVGIGAVPETSLAEDCGLQIENGVRANEFLTTSDPDIYTAGDCCSFPHGLFGGKRIRLEAWRNAQDQGIHSARNMLGAAERYENVPWFWSDQYEQTLMVAGHPDSGTQTVRRGSGDENYLFFHLDSKGRLVGASGIGTGIAKDIRVAEMLIERKAHPDPVRLGTADTKLKLLLRNDEEG
jgi:3-phenylpropionate/trans-cinnamate dioxygenase ferredoxin reductase subunit